MFNLRVNNQDYLELDSAASVTITLVNPAFDTQNIARTYSFPQQVPLTDKNRVILDHQHRLDTRSRKNEVPADVYIFDKLFDRGRALIAEHSDRSSELTFQNNDLSKIKTLEGIKLRELVGTIEIPQIETTYYVLQPEAGPNYLLTINGVLYSGGGLGVDLPTAMGQLVTDINEDYPGIASYSTPANELTLITTEETFVLSFSVTDFSLVSEQTLSDAREKNLQNYITTAAAGEEPVAFPVVYAPNFYPRNFRFRFYLNHRIDGDYLTNGYDTEYGWATTYVPFVRLRYLLDLIAIEIGIDDIVFDLTTEQAADLDSLLIYNNVALDNLRLETSVVFGEKEKNGFRTTINLADHLPDITAQQLIEYLAGYFNLNLRFERGILYLRPNLRQITSRAKDWTTITDPSFQRTTNAGGGVTIAFPEANGIAWAPTHNSYTVGEGTNTLTLPARPLHDRTLPLFEQDNEGWKVAAIEGQQGTSAPLDLETELTTMRIFFDRGQQLNEEDRPYWMGSTETTSYSGESIGTISLDMASDTGIYPNFWRGWTQYLFSPTLTRVTALTIDMILALKNWTDTKVYIYHPEGATNAVVESVQFKASGKGITQAKVEYRKFEP
jgi:hypothetical protein